MRARSLIVFGLGVLAVTTALADYGPAEIRRGTRAALGLAPDGRTTGVRPGDSRAMRPRRRPRPAEEPRPATLDTTQSPQRLAGTPVRQVSVTVQVLPLDPSPEPRDRFALMQNEPNPAFGATTLRFACGTAAHVELSLFSIQGQRVATPVAGDYSAGVHTVSWNTTDRDGRQLPPGVYVLRMKAGAFERSRNLVIQP